MKKSLITLVQILFVLNLSAQNPINTVVDNKNFLGKRYDTSFQNFITICNLSVSDFTMYAKQLGFDTKLSDDFCVLSYPQSRGQLQHMTKCNKQVKYWWMDYESQLSTLMDLYNYLDSNTKASYYNGMKSYNLTFNGKKYIFSFKSQTADNGINELLVIDYE
jgi:hypothetical protein